MILRIFPFEEGIICREDKIGVLEIVNPGFFASMVATLHLLSQGLPGKEQLILLEGEKALAFDKDVLLITDPFQLDFNHKSILTKIYQKIAQIQIQDDELRNNLENQWSALLQTMREILWEISLDFAYNNQWDSNGFCKLIALKLDTINHQNHLDCMLAYFDLLAELQMKQLVILVNIKCYFTTAQLTELYNHALAKKLNLLLIEPHSSPITWPDENKMIFDEDYDVWQSNM